MYFRLLVPFILGLSLIFSLEVCAASTSKVKGKLDNTSYSVLGLDSDGKGRTTKSSASGVFNIQATPGSNASLSLLSSTGEYAGPVVLAVRSSTGKLYTTLSAKSQGICSAAGTKAISALKFPSKKSKVLSLGVLKVDSDNQYAYITKKLNKKNLALSSSSAVDENCVPEGAGGKLGLSSSSGSALTRLIRASAAEDSDSDGVKNGKDLDDDNDAIPDSFDLDGDNDGVQDYNQAQSEEEQEEDDDGGPIKEDIDYFVYLFTNFQLEFNKAYNMHSMPVSQELIDSRVQDYAGIAMGIIGNSEFEVELDAHGLPYLSSGGTGKVTAGPGGGNGMAFPDEFDTDGDGLGRIDQIPSLVGGFDVQIKPNANTSQIKAGDVVSQVFLRNGEEIRRPIMLEFLFHTTPTLTSIKLGENAQSVSSISYPIQDGALGTNNNCFSYNAATQGHKLAFSVERPQRPGIAEAGEATFMDMGHLRYVVSASQVGGAGGAVVFCPVSSFSSTDPNLTLYTEANGEEGVLDNKGDTPFVEGQSNALSFSLDMLDCTGQSSGTYNLTIKARTPRNDNSGQSFCVTRQ